MRDFEGGQYETWIKSLENERRMAAGNKNLDQSVTTDIAPLLENPLESPDALNTFSNFDKIVPSQEWGWATPEQFDRSNAVTQNVGKTVLSPAAKRAAGRKPITMTQQSTSGNYNLQTTGKPYGETQYDTKPEFTDTLRRRCNQAIKNNAVDESIIDELRNIATQKPHSSAQAEIFLNIMHSKGLIDGDV